MARPLQKKKNKSSLSRVRQRHKSKAVNIKSNRLVAQNWDSSLTLRQNYNNLGLMSRLKASTGGIEKKYKNTDRREDGSMDREDSLTAFGLVKKMGELEVGRVKVVRDEVTGGIVQVVRDDDDVDQERERMARNPLNDPLNDIEDEMGGASSFVLPLRGKESSGGGRNPGIVPQLVEFAKYEKKKRPRRPSKRERDWIKRLVEQYGEDVMAMVRDHKLNPMQQSEGDLRRRLAVWRREQGEE